MGRRGPPPKPTKLKKAQGTYQKCRDRERNAVTLPAGAPPMPEDLPDAGRRRWLAIVPQLLEAGTLAKVDGGALEMYCRSFARWSELETEAGKKPVVKTPFGPKVHPAGEAARKLAKDVLAPLELALGLHYAARSRVKLPEKEKAQDPKEAFLFGAPPTLTAIPGGKSEGGG